MIPVNEPVIGKREMEYVGECLKTGWMSSAGRFIGKFEQAWAEYCGSGHGVAVKNGTLALQIALRAIDLLIKFAMLWLKCSLRTDTSNALHCRALAIDAGLLRVHLSTHRHIPLWHPD